MVTTNFKQLSKLIFERCAINKGILPVKATNGTTYYLSPAFPNTAFPGTNVNTVANSNTATGFVIGSNATPATEEDYVMSSTVTTAQALFFINTDMGVENGDPVLAYEIIIKNITNENLVINEIGYNQNLYAASSLNGTDAANRVCLLDRTVFEEPVTLEPGKYAVIRYVLSSVDHQ